jgi:peptide/nickel transport system substrate-binding protein
MRQRRVLTALAIPLALALVAASCGSDDSSSDATTAPDATEAADSTESTDATDATDETTPVEAPPDVDTTVSEQTDTPVLGGSVTIGLEAEATGLRPWEDGSSSSSYNITRAIYDTLTSQQESGGYGPYLAESLESNEDFTVWTMTLRPDITFHNGTPLTSQTIVDMFPIQQAGAAGSAAISASTLTSVAAVDDLTVEYTLASPNSGFAAALSLAGIGMPFDPAVAAADSPGYSINPIGTGPFVMKSRDIDNETVVEKNPDYWRTDADGVQLPYLDSVSYRPIPDEGTRLDALLSGTTTAMQTLRQGTIRDARDAGGDIELIEYQGNSTGGGMYNTAIAPFDDVRVRSGLTRMNNQDNVIEALGGTGISLPTTQWFSTDDPYWTQEAADSYQGFDFEGGQALLQEYIDDPARSDGKAPGDKIDVELSCPPDPTLIAAMQVIEQVWSGSEQINVTLTQFDQATHINNAISDTHKAHCWRWSGQGDPAALINPFVDDPEISISNFPNFVDAEMQQWAAEASATDDFETRKALYAQIMTRINEQAILWYSGGTATMVGIEPNIKGITNWTLPSGELGVGTPSAEVRWQEVFISDE